MFTSVNDTRLYFDVEGAQLRVDGDALSTVPTVVALHGGPGFDQGYLRPGLGPLRDVAQVVYVDLRGQGRSDPVRVETCSLEQMADDVAALTARLGLERPILLGHSAGGFVALHAALRHPDRVGGLVLCSTAATLAAEADPGSPTLADRAGPEAVEAARRVFSGDVSPEAGEAFGRLVAPHYAAPGYEHVPGRLFPLSRQALDVMHHFFAGPASRYDVRDRLADITAPTLVIAGGYDWVCPPAASRTIARGIPRAELVVLEQAGHFPFSERPEEFRRAVTEFLAGRRPAREPVAAATGPVNPR
ncbi:hydrolase [Cellulomonas chitinilytica]|uniref:Hydrolase n=1 Tax=Cellulomonas chitinilytica TaxID=398759 RepID=A0A919PA57_9CELL|nr:alpha/beta hydrolase [Cellulomonas chitinilytica]GIG23684.1 hydrolase [Cellulomonas chitinilytica]